MRWWAPIASWKYLWLGRSGSLATRICTNISKDSNWRRECFTRSQALQTDMTSQAKLSSSCSCAGRWSFDIPLNILTSISPLSHALSVQALISMVPAPIDRSNASFERRARRPRPANASEAVGIPIPNKHFELGVQPHEPRCRATHPLRRRWIREPACRQLPRRGGSAPSGPLRSHRPCAELWATRPGGTLGCFAAGPPHQLWVLAVLKCNDRVLVYSVRTDAL